MYLDTASKKAGGRPEEMGKSHALLFLAGWEGLNGACTHTQRERRKWQANIELHSLENQELF